MCPKCGQDDQTELASGRLKQPKQPNPGDFWLPRRRFFGGGLFLIGVVASIGLASLVTWLLASLVADVALMVGGTILVAGIVISAFLVYRRYFLPAREQDEADYQVALDQWKALNGLWDRLIYCGRDDIVFVQSDDGQDDRWAPADRPLELP